jgi:hypothetical protein
MKTRLNGEPPERLNILDFGLENPVLNTSPLFCSLLFSLAISQLFLLKQKNDKLGVMVEIHGVQYASIAEAAPALSMDRKTVSKRLDSSTPRFKEWKRIKGPKWKTEGDG